MASLHVVTSQSQYCMAVFLASSPSCISSCKRQSSELSVIWSADSHPIAAFLNKLTYARVILELGTAMCMYA
jgi:hypothetical protein